jgi:small subunit ribosomal protein S5
MKNDKNTSRSRFKKEKSEFDQKIIDISRVARVVSGGRRFSFRVALVAGDRRGRVGVGLGKSSDTSSAIEKAFRNAKKNMISLNLTKDFSLPYSVETKYVSAKILLRPVVSGHGLVAGSAVRNVLELGGVKGVNAKILSRSKNKLNIARATIKALQSIKPLSGKRGLVKPTKKKAAPGEPRLGREEKETKVEDKKDTEIKK